ncbi:type II toxin-antitoxin system RelE/ParE family toxin [Sporosarcina sp. FA9]|uniref:type II toxin-antitoxin system RelE/ParE family toxin n=1 Tax=Sporosarcina sp. FA9 TaxID=3413030 RepID=UPI003F656F34
MKLEWTEQALEGFRNIRSDYYTSSETKEYKKHLLKNIQEKVLLLGTSIPVKKEEWKGSYKIIIDKFIVYYSFSEDQDVCYIEYFIHSSRQK